MSVERVTVETREEAALIFYVGGMGHGRTDWIRFSDVRKQGNPKVLGLFS